MVGNYALCVNEPYAAMPTFINTSTNAPRLGVAT